MTDEVLVEHEDGLVIVTINRPEQRNAVNRAVSYAVCAAITFVRAWTSRLFCVVRSRVLKVAVF